MVEIYFIFNIVGKKMLILFLKISIRNHFLFYSILSFQSHIFHHQYSSRLGSIFPTLRSCIALVSIYFIDLWHQCSKRHYFSTLSSSLFNGIFYLFTLLDNKNINYKITTLFLHEIINGKFSKLNSLRV